MWLPVTSLLLRFNKSVCKSWAWRAHNIQTSFLVNRRLTTTRSTTTSSSSSSKFGSFILQTNEPCADSYGVDIKMFMLSSSESSGDDDDDDDQKKKKKMVFKVDDLGFLPFYRDFLLRDELCMVGSCNGIICLHDPDVMLEERGCKRQHYSHIRDVSLWNPATRQFRILPKMIAIEEKEDGAYGGPREFIAFGFDVETKDYKVLRITPCEVDSSTGEIMCRVQVYSLSTDSWRLLEDINSLPVIPDNGIYRNGSYFFVGRKPYTGYRMLLSFDFTKEIFTTIQFSENDVVLSSMLLSFDFTYCEQQGSSSSGQFLVNKESSSWTKLHWSPHTQPTCILNNGEFALISTTTDIRKNKLQLFNLITKEVLINDFTIGGRECRAAYVYKESLVSIMGGGTVLLRWQLPTHGITYYKLNLDAPFIDSYFNFGIGLCLTSDTGGCIGVRSVRSYANDAEEGEALAMLEAIKWAKKLELSPIIIESNSKKCVSFFMDDDDDNNNLTCWSSEEALSLLREAKLLLNSSELGIISIQYCSRSCNYVADIAAKLGREGFWCCKDWTANFPGEIVMSLSKDLGLET